MALTTAPDPTRRGSGSVRPDATRPAGATVRRNAAVRELTLTQLHQGVTVEQVRAETGWEL
ncbi:hypothetical protein, partial [Micromonospora sp. NPDC003241]